MEVVIKGTLKALLPQTITKKDGTEMQKVTVVISSISGEFVNDYALEVWREEDVTRCKALPIGSTMSAKARISSREWKEKWYTGLSAISIEAIPDSAQNIPTSVTSTTNGTTGAASNQAGGAAVSGVNTTQVADNQSDLPF